MPAKYDPGASGGIEGRIGKLEEGKHQGGAWTRQERIKRANSQRASLFLSYSLLPLFFSLLSSPPLPRPFCRFSLRTSHPVRFSSFHLYMDFFSRTRLFFPLFVEWLAQTCCTRALLISPYSISVFFLYLFFLPLRECYNSVVLMSRLFLRSLLPVVIKVLVLLRFSLKLFLITASCFSPKFACVNITVIFSHTSLRGDV